MDDSQEKVVDDENMDKAKNDESSETSKAKNNEIETDYLKKSESRDNLFIAVTAVLAGVFFIFIIYQIVTSPEQLFPLISCGIAFIVDIFLMIFSIQRKFEVQRLIEKRHFDEMFAAQKASYFVLRKNFDELQQRLNDLEGDSSSIQGEDIISAQKALTKVTINKNSENIKAVLLGQKKLIDSVKDGVNQEQKKLIDSVKEEVIQEQKKPVDSARDEVLQSNQELKYLLSDISTEIKSLKADIQQIESRQNMVHETLTPPVEPVQEESELATPVQEEVEQPVAEAVQIQEEPVPTPAPEVQDTSVDLSDPNRSLSPDEIAKLFASAAEPAPASQEPEESVKVQEEPAQAPEVQDTSVDLSDPNRSLSPEEIAKLFASMS